MFYLKNIFLVSIKNFQYIDRPLRLLLMATRGIIGGILLYLLINYMGLGFHWEVATGSAWFYFIMFGIGIVFCNVFAIAFMVLLPLDVLGLLVPILAWAKEAIIFVIGIIALMLIGAASFFHKAPNYSSMGE
jgi:hypothetical protein